MKRSVNLFVAFAASVLLFACNRNMVQLDFTTAKGEVPQLTNLEFRFDKALTPDSLLNKWDSTEYIDFSPKIEGKFRWEYPDKLVFSPAKPLLPATSYKATLNNSITKFSTFGSIKKPDITFHTPDLQLDNSSMMWVGSGGEVKTAQPQIDLHFNYPVDPQTLKDHLSLEVEGQQQNYSITTLNNDTKVSIRLLNFKAEDKDYTAKASVSKGMVPIGGKNPLVENIDEKLFIPSPYKLVITDAESDHDGTSGTVHIRASQEINETTLAGSILFTPAVKFTTELLDDGFAIHSEQFDVEKTYELNLSKALRGKIGGILTDAYTTNVAFGKVEPQISFMNEKGIYLSSKGAKNIEVKISNVEKVKVVISKIYENNILASQRYGYQPAEKNRYGSDEESEEEDYDRGGSEMVFGDVIMEKEIDTKTLPKYGNSRLFHFDITDQLPNFKGIYHIKIRSTKDYWVSDNRFISQSDIGLIAKEGNDKVLIFANSIKTAGPIEGVSINVYGTNNQLLGIATTNGQGIAEVPVAKNKLAGFAPTIVIAKTGEDFNYLPFSTTKVATSRFDVGGKRSNSTGLDAFIYGERNMYRPGETMHVAVVLRDKNWLPIVDVPIKIKFSFPNGKELATIHKTLNAQGGAEAAVPLNTSAITGSYNVEVFSGNDVLLAAKNLMVEEFLPDRIKVEAKLDKPFLLPGQSTKLNIAAQNFFGPPAANRNYELEIQLAQKAFNSKKFDRYNFSLANQNTFFDKVTRQGKTNEGGTATESYSVPDMYKNIGILQAKFYTTVFDETGRPVNRFQATDIFTQDYFVGVGGDGYNYYPLNQQIKFPLVAVDKDDKAVPGAKVLVNVIKHEYRTVLTKSGEYFRYESQKEDKTLASYDVTLDGNGGYSFAYTPNKPGDYEIRVAKQGANSYVSKSFYSYGFWGNNYNAAFQVNTEGHIDIEVDKEKYMTGDAAKILFKTPFNGKMLVTTETDHVLSYQYLDVTNRSASMEIKIAKEQLPNVYVTATLFKPHEVSDIPLTVANGFKSLSVEQKGRNMELEITAAKNVRSRTHQKVTVHAAANAMVTLAAVDNGVLQISDYKTPDPYDFFYAKRALEVDGYNMYPLLFPEIRGKMSSTGGDGYDLEKRTNPIRNKRIKLVSYWSGILQANGSGDASFEFDVPQFSGEIRLMAVAFKNESVGGKDAAMIVADPIVLSTALPRFMSPGDTVEVAVTVTNTTKKPTTAAAKLSVAAGLSVVGTASQKVTLSANNEAQVKFKIAAGATIQSSKILVEVNGLGEKFTDETDITIRPASTLMKQNGAGFVEGNQTKSISMAQNFFLQNTASYSLVVGKSPLIEFGSQLQDLVEYPYGCTEQTVSSAFPQLYYGDLSELMNFHKAGTVNANYNVQEAIRKIKMRQLYNGAITLWDGEGSENWWATVYAMHFLWEAKKAGFDVDKSLLESISNYCVNRLKSRKTIPYFYNGTQMKQIAPKEVTYSLYVLAMMNKPQTSVMNYYRQNYSMLSLDSKYMLSATYVQAGDKASFRQLLPTSFSGEISVPITGGSFYSETRDEAVALNCLLDVEPGNNQIPIMAKHVANKLKTQRYLSTQENAFGFLAMGKLARSANASNITASIKVNGKEVGKLNGKDIRLTNKDLAGGKVEITTTGSGRVYYYWVAEGIGNGQQYVEEDKFIKVSKHFYNRNGQPITSNTFKQNDLVIVAVSLENAYSSSIDNIVITDLLPAGFEIENPRTKEIPGLDWIKDAATPQTLDMRDDRINFFTNLGSQKQTFYYAVRAVSPGTYKMGPVNADAMYNGEYHSYNGAAVIRVVQ